MLQPVNTFLIQFFQPGAKDFEMCLLHRKCEPLNETFQHHPCMSTSHGNYVTRASPIVGNGRNHHYTILRRSLFRSASDYDNDRFRSPHGTNDALSRSTPIQLLRDHAGSVRESNFTSLASQFPADDNIDDSLLQ